MVEVLFPVQYLTEALGCVHGFKCTFHTTKQLHADVVANACRKGNSWTCTHARTSLPFVKATATTGEHSRCKLLLCKLSPCTFCAVSFLAVSFLPLSFPAVCILS